MELKGNLTTSSRLGGSLNGPANLSAGLTIPQLVYPGIYTGPYIITPEHEEQVLNTSNLLLTSDITVAKIPEPEFVEKVYDSGEIALEDTLYNGWTPSTTAKDIKASVNGTTFTADMANYEYIIKWSFGFNAVTVSGATLKAQLLYEGADQYQYINRRPSSYANIQALNNNQNVCNTYFTVPFMRYWNTSGTLTYTHSITYGVYPVLTAATFSSTTSNTPTVTPKSPKVTARCNSTYFATARGSELDQEESKFHITGEVWRYEIPGPVRKMYDAFYERMLDEQV